MSCAVYRTRRTLWQSVHTVCSAPGLPHHCCASNSMSALSRRHSGQFTHGPYRRAPHLAIGGLDCFRRLLCGSGVRARTRLGFLAPSLEV